VVLFGFCDNELALMGVPRTGDRQGVMNSKINRQVAPRVQLTNQEIIRPQFSLHSLLGPGPDASRSCNVSESIPGETVALPQATVTAGQESTQGLPTVVAGVTSR